jgi:hypothetical protein
MSVEKKNEALRQTLKESDELIDSIFDAVQKFKEKGNIIKKAMALGAFAEDFLAAVVAYKARKATSRGLLD